MLVHFLGTGTSVGVPHIGCTCEVCQSSDAHDKRLRTSLILQAPTGNYILLDCGPDFRTQILRFQQRHVGEWQPFLVKEYTYSLPQITHVLISHEHYDHVAGLDDLRPISYHHDIAVCGEAKVCEIIKHNMEYCFREQAYPGSPHLSLREMKVGETQIIEGLPVTPLRIMHGDLPILGYRIGDFAYITDMKSAPQETIDALHGVKTLVINGLRWENPHATHQTIEDALEVCKQVKAQQTWLIHMCHGAGFHEETNAQLPQNIQLAYDGLEIDV